MNCYKQLEVYDFSFTKKSFTVFLHENEFNKIHKGKIKIINNASKQLQYFSFIEETKANKIFFNEKLHITLNFINIDKV